MNRKVQNSFRALASALSSSLSITQAELDKFKYDFGTLTTISNRQITALKERVTSIQSKLKEDCFDGVGNKKKVHEVMKYGTKIKSSKRSNHLRFNSSHQQNSLNTRQSTVLTQEEQNSKTFQERLLTEGCVQFKQIQVNNILQQKVERVLNDCVNRDELQKVIMNLRESISTLSLQIQSLGQKQQKQKQIIVEPVQVKNEETCAELSNEELKGWVKNWLQQFQTKLKDWNSQMDLMKVNIQQLKQLNGQRKRKENRVFLQIDDLAKNQKKLFSKVQSNNDSLQMQLKQLKVQLEGLKINPYYVTAAVKSDKEQNKIDGFLINEVIQKIQVSLKGLVNQSQFLQFKHLIQQQLLISQNHHENMKRDFEKHLLKLAEDLEHQTKSVQQTKIHFQSLQVKFYSANSLNQKRISIAVARVEDIKTTLLTVKQDLQFYKSMNLNIIQPRMDVQMSRDESGVEYHQLIEHQKKIFNKKLHQQRVCFIEMIREMQNKLNQKEENEELSNIFHKLAEINLFLSKKVNEEDTKKIFSKLEKRIGNIEDKILENQKQDARIGKKSWLCLSCDKNVQNYHGKSGQHLAWDSMTPKNNQISWDSLLNRMGHTRSNSRQDIKKCLPTLKR